MILGSIAAMAQTKLKRLLAYSSIGHVGFLLIGFCCGTIEGVQALFIYIIIYTVMTCGLFCLLLSLQKHSYGFIESLSDLSMLARSHPLLALTITIVIFSMAGIPPLAGFCSKFYLFFAALSSSLYVLAFVGVLCSVISCFYYIRLIKVIYFEKKNSICFNTIRFENSCVFAFVGLFLIGFFIYPSPLFLWTHQAAIALCF
jgi:proton-translocating NADH-quinone oxidoreductase chain N